MVNTAYMYKTYCKLIRKDISQLRKEVALLNKTRIKFKSILLKHTELLTFNVGLTRSDLNSDAFYLTKYEFKVKDNSTISYVNIIPSLRGDYEIVRKCINKITWLKSNIDTLKAKLIPYAIYTKIIELYNLALVEELIKGESISLGRASTIHIIEKERKFNKLNGAGINRNCIDYPKSNEYKQYLIDKGEIPLEYYKDSNGKVIGNNNGVDWKIFNISEYVYWFVWNNHNCYIPNHSYYTFKPSTYNNEPYSTEQMKTMNIGNELFTMKLGSVTKATVYRNINPDILDVYRNRN